jgi:hypothetical protein
MVTNRNLIRQTGIQKCEKNNNWSLDYGCEYRIPTFRNPNQNSTTLWQIFSSNKHAPANRKKGFYPTVILTSWRLDSVLYEAAQNFEVFSNIQKGNKK